MKPILATARLRLRELSLEDAPFVLELLNTPLFIRFVGDRNIRTPEAARDYLANGPLASYARHGFGLWHVALKETGTPVGICGLLKRDVLADVDIGFAYLPAHSGQGYATEAAVAALAHGHTVLGIKRIVAITSPDNTGSQNVLRKLGLHHTATMRLPGYASDSFLFTPAP